MHVNAEIDAHAERVMRGEAPESGDPALAELAAFAAELRSIYQRPPSAAARERHLAAIVAEAATRGVPALDPDAGPERSGRRSSIRSALGSRRRRLAVRTAAIGIAALAGTAGLAVAGVKPPGPLDSALERVGIDSGKGEAPAVEERGSGGSSEGRQSSPASSPDRVSGAPSSPATRSDRRARGDERRSETGATNSAPGRSTAEEAQGGSAPPQSPGRSEENRPEGKGPPAAPGSQGKGSAQGKGGGDAGAQGTGSGKGAGGGSPKDQSESPGKGKGTPGPKSPPGGPNS